MPGGFLAERRELPASVLPGLGNQPRGLLAVGSQGSFPRGSEAELPGGEKG